jgi:hypothetical protein
MTVPTSEFTPRNPRERFAQLVAKWKAKQELNSVEFYVLGYWARELKLTDNIPAALLAELALQGQL